MFRYVRDNDDKALRRQAERIHLQSSSSVNVSLTSNTSTTSAEGVKTEPVNPATPSAPGGSVPVPANAVSTEGSKGPADVEKAVKIADKETVGDEEEDDESADKMWEDVDKDLGDILQEVEPGTKSSDDEDSRYDRFRNSEKKLHNKDKEREAGDKETEDKDGAKKIEGKIKIDKPEK